MSAGATSSLILSGSVHPKLSLRLASGCGLHPGRAIVERFPDGEHHLEVSSDVRGRTVYLVQPLARPAGESLLELLLLSDAARRRGARRVVGVVPYLAYARQDRRVNGTEPLGARVIADALCSAFDSIIVLDLHSPAVEGCFRIPVEHLSAADLLVDRLAPNLPSRSVVVSPDLGGIKRAEYVARRLGTPVAVIHKRRLSGREVAVERVVGDVKDCAPILVDDMISTGSTIASAVEALREAGCAEQITVAATHGVFAGNSLERLEALNLSRTLVTDSLPQEPNGKLEIVPIATLLADAVLQLEQGEPARFIPPDAYSPESDR